ncbi:MAG: hypothetical protein Q9225_003197 [Loekoesia sp. 1 TL-2023]
MALITVFIITLVIGLSVGLPRPDCPNDDAHLANRSPRPIASSPNIPNSAYEGWQPTKGTSWQIKLLGPLTNTSPDVEVFDIDLFDNNNTTITKLHSLNRKVICYFSAGSYEDWRRDENLFKDSDKGNPLDAPWENETWLDTNSENVRTIMRKRLDMAQDNGCDGVDPDNLDAYDNDNGLGLTTDDAINYINFLADEAHSRDLSIGLKNAGAILPDVQSKMQWSVNEECVNKTECLDFRMFIENNKPVFHIEYPDSAPSLSDKEKLKYCEDDSARGFSTLLKKMNLDDWTYECAGR